MSETSDDVPPIVSLDQVREELADVAKYAAAAALALDQAALTDTHLVFHVSFFNADTEFFAEFDCRQYPLHPPTIEFVDATRKKRGTKDLYPNVFHPMPCICARYNRKAYQSEAGGPHNDWRLIDWQLPTDRGPRIETLVMIVSDLHSKIVASTGRMG